MYFSRINFNFQITETQRDTIKELESQIKEKELDIQEGLSQNWLTNLELEQSKVELEQKEDVIQGLWRKIVNLEREVSIHSLRNSISRTTPRSSLPQRLSVYGSSIKGFILKTSTS